MAPIVITENELVQALTTANAAPEEARTVGELATLTGWGRAKVAEAIGRLAMQDRIGVHRKKAPGIDGRNISRPAYTILPPPQKRGGRK